MRRLHGFQKACRRCPTECCNFEESAYGKTDFLILRFNRLLVLFPKSWTLRLLNSPGVRENNVNFADPTLDLRQRANFGVISQQLVPTNRDISGARWIQFGLRVDF